MLCVCVQVKAIKLLSGCSGQGFCPPSPAPSALAVHVLPQQLASSLTSPSPAARHNGFPASFPSLTLSEADDSTADAAAGPDGVSDGSGRRSAFPRMSTPLLSSRDVPSQRALSLTGSEAATSLTTRGGGVQSSFIDRESPGQADDRSFTNRKVRVHTVKQNTI